MMQPVHSGAPASLGIEIADLRKEFPGIAAVRGVSFGVPYGKVVGLLGPNGAGKTTLMKMLACHLAPTSGQVRVAGIPWSVDNVTYKSKLGFLTREMSLYERLTTRENLAFFGALHGLTPERLAERIDRYAATLGLEAFLDRRYGELSTGQKQRANIASTLLHEPDVLLLDEITASLDILTSRTLLEFIRGQAGAGKAILYSTHIMGEAEFLCDLIVFLHRGRVLGLGTPRELMQRWSAPNLTEAFYRAMDGAEGTP